MTGRETNEWNGRFLEGRILSGMQGVFEVDTPTFFSCGGSCARPEAIRPRRPALLQDTSQKTVSQSCSISSDLGRALSTSVIGSDPTTTGNVASFTKPLRRRRAVVCTLATGIRIRTESRVVPNQRRQLFHALGKFAPLPRNGEPPLFLESLRTAEFQSIGDTRAVRRVFGITCLK